MIDASNLSDYIDKISLISTVANMQQYPKIVVYMGNSDGIEVFRVIFCLQVKF